jgi:hypothetical protein
MADTKRTQTQILTLFADNQNRQIGEQDLRDGVVSGRANQGDGWEFYSDSVRTTQGTAQQVTAATRTKLLCDGLGSFTTTTYNTDMEGPIWTANQLNPILHSAYIFRLTFKCQTAAGGQSNYFELDMDIGAGGLGTGPVVWKTIETLVKGAGVEHAEQFAIPAFAEAPFPANGGSFWITPNVNLDVWDVRIFAARIYKADN